MVRDTGIESFSGEYEVRLVPVLSLLSQHAVNRGPAHTQRGRDGAGRFTAGVHPLCQSGFGGVECFGAPNSLLPRPTCFPCCSPPFPAYLKFKLSQAGEYAGHHSSGCVRGVNPLP
jgi:hypothetical protein